MQFPVPIPVFSLWASPPKCICYLTCTSTTLAQATTISLLSWIPVASELVLLLCPHSIHSIPIVASACTLWKHRSDHITPLLNPPPPIFPTSFRVWSESMQYLPGRMLSTLRVPSPTPSPTVRLPCHSSSLPGDVAHLK